MPQSSPHAISLWRPLHPQSPPPVTCAQGPRDLFHLSAILKHGCCRASRFIDKEITPEKLSDLRPVTQPHDG